MTKGNSKMKRTNQKWPTGPTKPKPNMLVIATRFQLILNSAPSFCYMKQKI